MYATAVTTNPTAILNMMSLVGISSTKPPEVICLLKIARICKSTTM